MARTDTTETDALDRQDMAQLASGDDLALNRLMDRHAPAVLRFLGQMLGNAADAEDLAQETFVRVYQARQRFRPNARFTPWLFTIAANLARNHRRWKGRHPALPLDHPAVPGGLTPADTQVAPGADPHLAATRADELRAVQDAINALPANMRNALTLCAWEDLDMQETARVLGTSPKAIESLLYRARRILRDRLQRWL